VEASGGDAVVIGVDGGGAVDGDGGVVAAADDEVTDPAIVSW